MTGWKIYFILLLIIYFMSYMGYEEMRLWELIDLVLFITSMIGLYGFSWSRKLFTPQFWKSFIIASIIWNTGYNYFIPLPAFIDEIINSEMSQASLATLSLIPYIPCLIGVYLYGFKRPALWEDNNNNSNV